MVEWERWQRVVGDQYNVVGLEDSTDIYRTGPCRDAGAGTVLFKQAVKVVEYIREQVTAQDSALEDATDKVDDAAVVSVRSRKTHTSNTLQASERLDSRASIHTSLGEGRVEHCKQCVPADCGGGRTTHINGHDQRRQTPGVESEREYFADEPYLVPTINAGIRLVVLPHIG